MTFRRTLCWLLVEKYPHRLPDVFRAVIDTREGQHHYAGEYAAAVARAPVAPADARRVLTSATLHDNSDVRTAGITHLRALDPKLAKGRLLFSLAEVPGERNGHLLAYAELMTASADPDEWRALARAVPRAGVGGRIALLNRVWTARAPAARRHQLALLAEHLNDDEYDGDRGWWGFEVRNLAALRLADLLGVEARPDVGWGARQWSDLRARVRAALEGRTL
ncbi:MAG: hypothetical protein FJ304_17840 [Planctomycetes bacterium]|nr:hypothetical protein [Planctomycetota bacterium]